MLAMGENSIPLVSCNSLKVVSHLRNLENRETGASSGVPLKRSQPNNNPLPSKHSDESLAETKSKKAKIQLRIHACQLPASQTPVQHNVLRCGGVENYNRSEMYDFDQARANTEPLFIPFGSTACVLEEARSARSAAPSSNSEQRYAAADSNIQDRDESAPHRHHQNPPPAAASWPADSATPPARPSVRRFLRSLVNICAAPRGIPPPAGLPAKLDPPTRAPALPPARQEVRRFRVQMRYPSQ